MIAQRKVFDVAVVAGENNGRAFQIKSRQHRADEAGKQGKNFARCFAILRVANLVGDEVFVERELIRGDNTGQHFAGFFRSTRINFLAALNQQSVREVMIDGRAGS